MDKTILKEIALLAFEVIKAIGEILWRKIKNLAGFIRNKLFGKAGVTPQVEETEQEWGVTGEDIWPGVEEKQSEELKESYHEVERREVTEVLPPSPPSPVQEKQEEEITGKETLPRVAEPPYEELKEYPQRIEKREIIPEPPAPELPESYGDNRITLMMRDPSCLFTYWELRKDRIDNVLQSLGPLAHTVKMVLRVYDITDITFTGNNMQRYFDIDITGEARSRYIRVEPDKLFFVDIGLLSVNGTFRILSRSNSVRTPRASVSEVVDEKWMFIKEFYEKEYLPSGLGSEYVFKKARKDRHKIFKEGVHPFESSSDLMASKG